MDSQQFTGAGAAAPAMEGREMRLRLEFEVDYDFSEVPEGDEVTQEELADLLAMIAHNAMSNGTVTGETPATVENSHICVRDLETGELI